MMNDDDLITGDLITMVREPFAGIHLDAPAEAVMARGRSIRRRRRTWAAGVGTAAVAAVTALVTVVALPGSSGGHRVPVSLAAWTVVTQPGGTVAVTIHDLRDPAGLQRALRAHGVPARVTYYRPGSLMPGCMTVGASRLAITERRVFTEAPAASHGLYLLYIHPAAVPKADQIAIQAVRGSGFSIGLLTLDGRCPPGSVPGQVGVGATGQP